MNLLLAVVLLFTGAACQSANRVIIFPQPSQNLRKDSQVCAVVYLSGTGVETGAIRFTQQNVTEPVFITGTINGLTPGKHGFHVHKYGSTEKRCLAAGGHYNPFSRLHGGQTASERHVGDLGNIMADRNGVAQFAFSDTRISLFHSSLACIIGKSIVVHEGEDDLGLGGDEGSRTTGNAGARAGCGVIGFSECTRTERLSKISVYAMATLSGPSSVTGLVSFRQEGPNSPVFVKGSIQGFGNFSNGLHGFHIHEYGDIARGCQAAGGHFNPSGVNHGAPRDKVRHVGDLGNVKDEAGSTQFCLVDNHISLFPGTNSIIGRGVVVHQNMDDLGRGGNDGSLTAGNAGPRLACGVVGTVDDDPLASPVFPASC